jgi:hypothetical protein
MKINLFSPELTGEVGIVRKAATTQTVELFGVKFFLEHGDLDLGGNDKADTATLTLWLRGGDPDEHLRVAQMLEKAAGLVLSIPKGKCEWCRCWRSLFFAGELTDDDFVGASAPILEGGGDQLK